MSRLFRISFVALSLLVCATGVFASIPNPEASDVPDVIVLSPGVRYAGNSVGQYTIVARGANLAVIPNAQVEIEISPGADAIVGWCQAPYGGVSGQTHPIIVGVTNVSGVASFEFYGGACLDPTDFFGASFIAQVRVNGIVMKEPTINSPDVVNSGGKKATDVPPPVGARRCDIVATFPSAQVSLSDAVFHTRPIKLGLKEFCTKFTPPFNAAVGLTDAVVLTPYIKNSNFCKCQ
jgi:hypothetical protein